MYELGWIEPEARAERISEGEKWSLLKPPLDTDGVALRAALSAWAMIRVSHCGEPKHPTKYPVRAVFDFGSDFVFEHEVDRDSLSTLNNLNLNGFGSGWCSIPRPTHC